jgi:putative heme iron utilization protein
MNGDHAEAIALYAQVYGDRPHTEAAEMVDIDPQGMTLNATTGDTTEVLRIEFDHTLADSDDAHHTLVAMLKQARQK